MGDPNLGLDGYVNRRLAEYIDVDLRAQTVAIDGVTLPYILEKNTIKILTRDDELTGVQFTVWADKGVRVNDVQAQKGN